MNHDPIVLIEDNPDDIALTVRAFKRCRIANDLVVLEDGAVALDYLFCQGMYAQRDPNLMPQLVLLDLKLPKIDGLDVLRRIRADERTKVVPVVMLTSSQEESDVITSYSIGANSYVRKPVDFTQFVEVVNQLGLYWVILNLAPVPGAPVRASNGN